MDNRTRKKAAVGFHNPNYVLGFLYCLMTAVFHSLPIHHDTHLVIVLLYRAKGQMKWNFQIICFQKWYSVSKLNPLWRSTSTLVESTVFCRQTRRWVLSYIDCLM